jgi:hypothetical protein|tara:strand:+ start:105 stop:323 length:219 start_codon:yes stop_codon:yes gene_type:complete
MSGPYVPIEDLARHLHVSVSTIRGWVRNKHIPEDTYLRVVNTYRFSIDDVTAALSADKGAIDTPTSEVDEDL